MLTQKPVRLCCALAAGQTGLVVRPWGRRKSGGGLGRCSRCVNSRGWHWGVDSSVTAGWQVLLTGMFGGAAEASASSRLRTVCKGCGSMT
jgi:hypothetical protein